MRRYFSSMESVGPRNLLIFDSDEGRDTLWHSRAGSNLDELPEEKLPPYTAVAPWLMCRGLHIPKSKYIFCSSAYSRGNKDGESAKSLWISYPDHKRLKIERQDFELALNCPGHCLIVDHRVRSYRG
ncbi:hypothetical protein RHGRI_034446 [Rhododendron griersonianum]|uniref:Uncharacterized protein n=1 Tax=Rhododendron griersonianum TaxID=479676 RepID=A0AAV6I0R3_9ERIC|nr:hypothetical protein RHGRI_034446 [Rhododendron griersonianum]